jgi:hypothetical protein
MNSVEEIIREKLKAALENETQRVASALLSDPVDPPIPDEGFIAPTYESYQDGKYFRFEPGDNVTVAHDPEQGTSGVIHKSDGIFHHVHDKNGKYLGIYPASVLKGLKEAFADPQNQGGRPLTTALKPTNTGPLRRMKKHAQIAKAKEKLQKTLQTTKNTKDVRTKNAKLAAARMKLGALHQELGAIK